MTFRNPITVASGTFGTRDEFRPYLDYEALGAVITKTITVKPRAGNPMPRICETTGGMLNAIGLQNKGLEDFIREKIPYFSRIRTPLIVNIAGEKENDFRVLTRRLHEHKRVVRALELNLSCPNVEAGGASAMRRQTAMIRIVKTVKSETDLPVIAKLSPELGDVTTIAGRLIKAGADGFSLINTLKGMAIDLVTRRPRLANVTGGLSGPAIKPVALRHVYEVKRAYNVPVIAMGGVMTGLDAAEFLIAGADLVAVGTANFVHPAAVLDILAGLEAYCVQQGIRSLDELRGSLNLERNFKTSRGGTGW